MSYLKTRKTLTRLLLFFSIAVSSLILGSLFNLLTFASSDDFIRYLMAPLASSLFFGLSVPILVIAFESAYRYTQNNKHKEIAFQTLYLNPNFTLYYFIVGILQKYGLLLKENFNRQGLHKLYIEIDKIYQEKAKSFTTIKTRKDMLEENYQFHKEIYEDLDIGPTASETKGKFGQVFSMQFIRDFDLKKIDQQKRIELVTIKKELLENILVRIEEFLSRFLIQITDLESEIRNFIIDLNSRLTILRDTSDYMELNIVPDETYALGILSVFKDIYFIFKHFKDEYGNYIFSKKIKYWYEDELAEL